MKMEAVCTYETTVSTYKTVWCHYPEEFCHRSATVYQLLYGVEQSE